MSVQKSFLFFPWDNELSAAFTMYVSQQPEGGGQGISAIIRHSSAVRFSALPFPFQHRIVQEKRNFAPSRQYDRSREPPKGPKGQNEFICLPYLGMTWREVCFFVPRFVSSICSRTSCVLVQYCPFSSDRWSW